MSEQVEKPNRALLQRWLTEAKVDFGECDECEGLHLAALQTEAGVIDSRLFLERYGLLMSSELEIRPMALLPLSADLGRINMDYPTLKVFLDVVDDATPQLIMAAVLPTQAGLTLAQCAHFVSTSMEATRRLCAECLQLDYLFAETEGEDRTPRGKRALH